MYPCIWIARVGQTQGHSSTVWDVCFDRNGEHMATCSDDLSIKIWSLTLSHGTYIYTKHIQTDREHV